jgi:hypothetical protein
MEGEPVRMGQGDGGGVRGLVGDRNSLKPLCHKERSRILAPGRVSPALDDGKSSIDDLGLKLDRGEELDIGRFLHELHERHSKTYDRVHVGQAWCFRDKQAAGLQHLADFVQDR